MKAKDNGLVWAWVDSCCYAVEGASTKAVSLWLAYREWSQDCSLKILPRETFYRRLGETFPISSPPRYVSHLVLKPEEDWDYWDVEEVRKVYFLSDGQAVKIGVSQDPEMRLNALRVGSSQSLVLLGWVPGGFDVETELHERFKELRGQGEWFYLAPDEVTEVIDARGGCLCGFFQNRG